MSDVQLLSQYERTVVRLKKYLPRVGLRIENNKFVLEHRLDDGSVEQVLFVTDKIRELDIYVEGVRKGLELCDLGEIHNESQR